TISAVGGWLSLDMKNPYYAPTARSFARRSAHCARCAMSPCGRDARFVSGAQTLCSAAANIVQDHTSRPQNQRRLSLSLSCSFRAHDLGGDSGIPAMIEIGLCRFHQEAIASSRRTTELENAVR